ncbi:gag-pol polyprotein [Tanacetum coccineum]
MDHMCQCSLFKMCPYLEVLSTSDKCGDKGLQVIGKFCKKLCKLTHYGLVTHVGPIALAKGCTNLEYLNVSLRDISNEALECVGKHMKNLRNANGLQQTQKARYLAWRVDGCDCRNICIDVLVEWDDDDLTNERDLLASLIQKLKWEIDESKNRNKLLESSNNILVDKLKREIKDFKTKNKSLESSNNHFKEANNELSKTNQLMYKDLKKFQAELDGYHDVNYASKVAIDCAKAKGDLMSYKMESEKSFNERDIQERDKKKAKNDQTKHGMEKTKSNQSQSQKVNPDKVKSQPSEENTT